MIEPKEQIGYTDARGMLYADKSDAAKANAGYAMEEIFNKHAIKSTRPHLTLQALKNLINADRENLLEILKEMK